VSSPGSPQSIQRSGVAVVNVWYEADESAPRARINAESGGFESRRETFVAAGVDEICQRLRDWLLRL